MPEKTLSLPDVLYERIKGIFGDDAINSFAITAMEELMSWLIAEQRPTSISDLETNRIFTLYRRLYKDLLPTAEDIGKLFNLPMGRSRYIVQNLNYRYPDFMKKRRIAAIRVALEKNEVSEEGLPVAIIPKECADYLLAISTEMVLSNPRQIQTTPSFKRLSEDIRVELGANDRQPLLNRLRAEESKLKLPEDELEEESEGE